MSATSLAQALDLILHGLTKTANPEIFLLDYRDPATFTALWLESLESGKWSRKMEGAENEEQIDLTDSSRQFLLIGNDPPDGIFDTSIPALAGINFRSHFTATSWLAAWTVKFTDSKVAFTVIDPLPTSSASGVAKALQMIFTACEATGQSLVPRATVLNAPSLICIYDWLKASKADNERLSSDYLRELIKSVIWNSLVGNAETHHSISNVMGSSLLGGQNAIGCWGDLLSKLFSCLGVKVHTGSGDTLNPEQVQTIDCPVLLFDDMANLWKEPLNTLFGISGRIPKLIVSPSVGSTRNGALKNLVETLESSVKAPYSRRQLTMGDLGVEGEHSGVSDFILLLDLRLFGTTSEALSNERALFERLYQAHEDLAASDESALSHPPWPRLQGGQWLDGITSQEEFSTGYRKARALLPKLLSLVDPTLPIVVFSSTHDSDVLGELLHNGNIVTCFRKPVFRGAIGDFSEWQESIFRSFKEAIDRANGILNTRRQLNRFRSSRSTRSVLEVEKEQPVSVEVFLDESGSAAEMPFGIGGIVVISKNQAGFDHRKFAEKLKNDNKLWGASMELPFIDKCNFPNRYASKGSGLSQQPAMCDLEFGYVQSAASEAFGELHAFGLLVGQNPSKEIFSPRHPHNRYRNVLRDVLELLLFHYDPVVEALERGAWLGVDAATWSPTWMSKWGDLTSAKQNLGIETQGQSKDRYTGLRRADLFPLLIDVINRSGVHCKWRSKIKRARAVQLVDFGRTDDVSHALYSLPECSPYQIHYLADWVAHFAVQEQRRGAIHEIPTLKKMFEKGWLQEDDSSFQAALLALRLWNQGREVEALEVIGKVELRSANGDAWPWSFGRFYSAEFGSWAQRISDDKLRLSFAAMR